MKTYDSPAACFWLACWYMVHSLCAAALLSAILLVGCSNGFSPPQPDFSLTVTTSTQSMQAGTTQQVSLLATSLNGFNGMVDVSFTDLPSGVTAPVNIVLTPGLSQAITLAATASASRGPATIVVEGKSGTQVHAVAVSIDVMPPPPDFSLAATSSQIRLQAGGPGRQIQFTLNGINGFTSPVTVALNGLPAGITAIPSSLSLNPGASGQITFNAANSAKVGTSTIIVTGTSGTLTHSVTIALNVTAAANFTLSASPGQLAFRVAGSTQFSVSASPLNGWDTPINVAIEGLPQGVSATPSAFSLLPGVPQTIVLTAATNAAVGSSNLIVTANAGSVTQTAAISVLIQPILAINVYPATFNLAPGLSQTLTITATVGALSNIVAVAVQGLPPGISVSPSSLSLSSGVAQNFVFTADSDFTAGGSATLQASIDNVAQTQKLAFNALPASTSMVTNGLMAYFPMSEGTGTTINDTSGNGYIGTFGGSGNTWTSAGVLFNGNGWIDLPPDLNTAQTIQMWLNVPQPSGVQTLIGTAANAGADSLVWALNNQSLFLTYNGVTGTVSATPFNGSATIALAEGSSSPNSLDQYWINDAQAYALEPTWSAIAGVPVPGHLQIAASEGVNGLSGTAGPIAFYDRQLTPAEIAQNSAFFNQLEQTRGMQTQEANNSSQNQFIAMGDSITYGLGASQPYCARLTEPAFNSLCLGFIGQTTSLGVLQAPEFANYYNRQAKWNLFFNWYMSNDVEESVANAQILQNLQTTCNTIKQIYPGSVVVIGTMMSHVNIADSIRFALNDMIRQQNNNICDGYIDMAADPVLGASGAYADSYFADGVHPDDPGNEQIAGIITRYINSVTGATPASPTVQSSPTYTMTTADNFIDAEVQGDASWTLPECVGLTGKVYTVTNQGAGSLSVAGVNGEAISGSPTIAPDSTGAFQIELASDATGGCSWARE
jgi:GDSL-like Lipase/Acylhydrolase family